jgi:transcriptional antiterminator NusG
MTQCFSEALWHVAHVAPRAERDVAEDIEQLGLEPYVPMEKLIVVRRGRRLDSARALLSSYVFFRRDPHRQAWQDVLDVEGVVDVLMASQTIPGYIPAAWIEAMRKAEAVGIFDRTTRSPSQFRVGETIRISDGPFEGFNGLIEEFIAKMRSATASKRAKIAVQFMGRITKVDLDLTSIEKL